MNLSITELKPGTADELFRGLRSEDAREVIALGWENVCDGIAFTTESAEEAFEARIDGRLVAVFGITAARDDLGIPWMLGTDALTELEPRVALVRIARQRVAAWRARFGSLWNLVHAENRRSIEWLEVIGFELGDPVPMPPHDALFVPFFMR